MTTLDAKLLTIDDDDAEILRKAVGQFQDVTKVGMTGKDGKTYGYPAYNAVFSIALLRLTQTLERLSRRLEFLTWALVCLTFVILLLTIKLAYWP